MKKIKNENGSVLVLIIVVIAVLSVLGTSILAAAYSNYLMKTTNLSLKSNLYVSEAGLEEAYGKVYGYVVDAVDSAKTASNNKLKEYDETQKVIIDGIIAEIEKDVKDGVDINTLCVNGNDVEPTDYSAFKYPQFKYYTVDEKIEIVFNREWIALNADEIEKRVDEVFAHEFKYKFLLGLQSSSSTGFIKDGDKEVQVTYTVNGRDTKITAERKKDGQSLVADKIVDISLDGNDNDLNRGNNENIIAGMFSEDGSKLMTIKLTSKYADDLTERETEVDLEIRVPSYKEPYTVTVSKKEIDIHPLWKQALATDYTLSFNNGKTNVVGNIYSHSKIDVSGELTVSGTTVASDSANNSSTGEIEVKGKTTLNEVYARNVLLKAEGIEYIGKGAHYVKDDFEMNEDKQTVTIKGNYYGFSDGSTSTDGPDNSSGIIINSTDIGDGSSFTLNGDLWINGVSYINLGDKIEDKYQTGESLSVRGNYLAYTMPLVATDILDNNMKKYSEDNVEFTYKDPLMLADLATVGEKVDYFYLYYEAAKKGNYSGLYLNGVTVTGDIKSMGSVVKGTDEVFKGAGNNNIKNENKFINMNTYYNETSDYLLHTFEVDTETSKILKSPEFMTGTKVSIANDIDFDAEIKKDDDTIIRPTGSGEFRGIDQDGNATGFLYTTGNVTITVGHDSAHTQAVKVTSDAGGNFTSTHGKIFIITSGKVTINNQGADEKTIRGCIIARDGIDVNGNIKFIYDDLYIKDIFDEYKNLGDIFTKARKCPVEKYNSKSIVQTYIDDDGKSIYGTNIEYTKILDFKNWKIK